MITLIKAQTNINVFISFILKTLTHQWGKELDVEPLFVAVKGVFFHYSQLQKQLHKKEINDRHSNL